jgi:hypothetical protein
MAIDVLKEHIPGVKEHGIVTDANVTLSGTTTLPTGTLIGSLPIVLTSGQLTTVSDSAVYTLGSRARDAAGNEYIFLKGATSVAANDFVFFRADDYTAVRLVVTAIGDVAVAMAAVNAATKYGWFQIYGKGTGANASAILGATGAAALYAHAVTGAVLTTMVSGDLIHGAVSIGSQSVTGGGFAVQLNYPFINQAGGSY